MSETVTGTVEKIRFADERTHWTVATVTVAGERSPSTLVGELPGLAAGMKARFEGRWLMDPRFGRQFRAESYLELVPATRAGVAAYLGSGFIDGIGSALAERVVAHFGEETLEIIEKTPERLREVPGIGAKRARGIAEALRARRSGQQAKIFLFGLGLTAGMANKISQRYGDATVATVRANPYRLTEDVRGIGFHKADRVARGLRIDRDHPARARAGVVHVLKEALGEGHCFLYREGLIAAATALLGVGEEAVEHAIAGLLADRVVIEERAGGDSAGEPALYLSTIHEAETELARHLARLLSDDAGRAVAGDPRAAAARAEARLGIVLAPGQRRAVVAALEAGLLIITGGPGTGKTTIVRTLLGALALPSDRVALAAPTGRAAKRLSEATGLGGRTIHRLLEFAPAEGRFQRGSDNPLDVDVVIVDEASMIDVLLLRSLLAAVPGGARLVLVGDADQLPPVGPGSPLASLIASGRVPVARLSEIFRQAGDSAIVRCAHEIMRGHVPAPTGAGTPLRDFYFIERAEPAEILATMEHLVTTRIPRRFGLSAVEDIQVIAPMRTGPLGVEALNARFQELLNPPGPAAELRTASGSLRVGDKVMQVRNDYDKGVFNGDMGLVSAVEEGGKRLLVAVDGRAIAYERDELDDLVLAYAITVHKSQGSEYPALVMPISTQHFKMLQRNLIYTAITRGKRLVVLVGTVKAMGIAVRRDQVAVRNSLLQPMLDEALRAGGAR